MFRMLVAISDFPVICRICLGKSDLKPFEENIIEIIEIITGVNVMSESDLPKKICFKCIKDLMDILMFMDKIKYNNMFLKFVLLNHQNVKQEPSEEIFLEPGIEINHIEPDNTIEQTSVLRNLLNYENLQKEEPRYKFGKNNVKTTKGNNYCVCIQCKELENDSDFETQSLEKKLKIYHSPRRPKLRKIKMKKLKLEEYKYKPEPKETPFGCCPTGLKRFSTNTTLNKDMSRHNMTLNWVQSQSVGTMSLKDNKFEPPITLTPKSEPKPKIDIVKISPGQKESLYKNDTKGKIFATKLHCTTKSEISEDQNFLESKETFTVSQSQLIKDIIDTEFPA